MSASIHLDSVGFRYEHAQDAALVEVSLDVAPGEVVLVCGGSGSGKTTLLRVVNGLAPQFYPGELTGQVSVAGTDPTVTELPQLARLIATVFQDPKAAFFTTDVASELAFGPENLGLPQDIIGSRVTRGLERFNLAGLRDRSTVALSGGEQQRLACAVAQAMAPSVLVLDEPSSSLDELSLASLAQTLEDWKAQGKTIIMAEHQLDYVVPVADRIVVMQNGRIVASLSSDDFSHLDDERRHVWGLRSSAAAVTSGAPHVTSQTSQSTSLVADKVLIKRGDHSFALSLDHAEFPAGAITAVVGPNGVGKTTLARWLAGLLRSSSGSLAYQGHGLSRRQRLRQVNLVAQNVNHQLFTESVRHEVELSAMIARRGKTSAIDVDDILARCDLLDLADRHPMTLSGGQRQRLAIAAGLASMRPIIILDEPTSGLDWTHMNQVAECLSQVRDTGRTVIVITHDRELVAAVADDVIRLTNS
ncbi:MAG: ABC transporter ATP-binding protein [Propionibacteriaceae bacterium]|jgi:energy-coupling factor transport system ATP-binding protein|nr:ABC transporter ATP-binding protein [Propionibacteriaceae bacterium]